MRADTVHDILGRIDAEFDRDAVPPGFEVPLTQAWHKDFGVAFTYRLPLF